MAVEGADRQVVALLAAHLEEDLLEELRCGGAAVIGGILGSGPALGHVDLPDLPDALVDGGAVHIHNILALSAVSLADLRLQIGDGLLHGEDLGEGEEASLHHHVDAAAEAQVLGDVYGVQGIELGFLFPDTAFELRRQLMLQLLRAPDGVQQEDAALLQITDKVILIDVGLVVAGDEVGRLDLVGALDLMGAEAQMADGDAAGLLGVVGEVCLDVVVRVVADDLDGGLVGTHGAVGAQAPELAGEVPIGGGVKDGGEFRQGVVGDIVHDGNGEAVLGVLRDQVGIDGHDIHGSEVLGAQTVAAADDEGSVVPAGVDIADIQVERFTHGAGLLGAVQHRNALHGLRNHPQQVLGGEGTVQVDLHESQLLPSRVPVADGLADDAAGGAHGDDDVLGIRRTEVVEGLIVRAGQGVDLVHAALHDAGNGLVELVDGLPDLEEDIRALGGAAGLGMVGVQGVAPEGPEGILVNEALQVGLVQQLDLLVLMAGAEAIEKVQHRQAAGDGAEVRDTCHVVSLLDCAARQHGKAGVAAGHDVLMVTVDGEGVGGQRAGADVEDAWQQLAGDLVHVWQHKHQTLTGRIGASQCAALQCAVDGTGGAALVLHFPDFHRLSEDILPPLGAPLINELRHGGGGSDGINRGDLGKGIGGVSRRRVAIHRRPLEFLAH